MQHEPENWQHVRRVLNALDGVYSEPECPCSVEFFETGDETLAVVRCDDASVHFVTIKTKRKPRPC